ncbi:DNA polymerase III subunit delta' C-terminal domain-containing protein, partial [Pantoea sp.]
WQARQSLCAAMPGALQQDIMQLLPVLNGDDAPVRIGWLLTLLVDAMKWQQGATHWLTNCDRSDLVSLLTQHLSASALSESVQFWMLCRDRLLNVQAVNRELLITDRLLAWERLMKPATIG